MMMFLFFFSSRRRHTRWPRDWSSDVCSSDLDCLAAYSPGQCSFTSFSHRCLEDGKLTSMWCRVHMPASLARQVSCLAQATARSAERRAAFESHSKMSRASCRDMMDGGVVSAE